MIVHVLTHGIIPKALLAMGAVKVGPRIARQIARALGSVF